MSATLLNIAYILPSFPAFAMRMRDLYWMYMPEHYTAGPLFFPFLSSQITVLLIIPLQTLTLLLRRKFYCNFFSPFHLNLVCKKDGSAAVCIIVRTKFISNYSSSTSTLGKDKKQSRGRKKCSYQWWFISVWYWVLAYLLLFCKLHLWKLRILLHFSYYISMSSTS